VLSAKPTKVRAKAEARSMLQKSGSPSFDDSFSLASPVDMEGRGGIAVYLQLAPIHRGNFHSQSIFSLF